MTPLGLVLLAATSRAVPQWRPCVTRAARAAIHLSELPSKSSLKEQLKQQLQADERGWPGTISRESLAMVQELEDADLPVQNEWTGDYDVLSCDPLTIALEYNEANVVRGGALLRVTAEQDVELRIEIKWRSDEILPVELNGTVAAATCDDGGATERRVAVVLTDGAVRSPTSGEIQDMMDAQGTLREKAMPAVQRHGGFGATLAITYHDGDLIILRCQEKQPQCAQGTVVILSRAEPEAFEESWYKYARARVYYDALGREKNMDLPMQMPF